MKIDSIAQPNSKLITNVNGKFYAGMTLDEARQNGTDKMFLRRDFQNIDKNKDGVLSVDEIIAERKRSAINNRSWAGFFALTGILDCILDRHNRGWFFADLIFNVLVIGLELRAAQRTEAGTKRIEDMLANNQSQNITTGNN